MGAQRRRASKYQPSPKFRGLTGANFRYIRLTYFQRFAFFDGARGSGEGEAFGGISRNGGARFQRKRPRILPVKSGLGRNNERCSEPLWIGSAKRPVSGADFCENFVQPLCHCARILEKPRRKQRVVVELVEHEFCRVGVRLSQRIEVFYDFALGVYLELYYRRRHFGVRIHRL